MGLPPGRRGKERCEVMNYNNDLECNHLNGTMGVTQKIKNAMEETAKQFVYIGFLLWEVKEYKYYYENGYDSVYEYAEAELGFKRSSTKNFIAICETFCRRSGQFRETPTMFLADNWNQFKYSQLTEMLSMSAEKRKQATPDMTIKQLRELKREPEEPKPVPKVEQASDAIGQTSGHREPTPEEAADENERLSKLYYTEGNPTIINGEEIIATHYLLTELCRLAGMKYIDWEDYEVTIRLKDDPEPTGQTSGLKIQVNDASKPYSGPELRSAGLSIDSGFHAALKQETLENLCEIACMKFNKKGRYHIAIYEEIPR